jgi:hypothetical protein
MTDNNGHRMTTKAHRGWANQPDNGIHFILTSSTKANPYVVKFVKKSFRHSSSCIKSLYFTLSNFKVSTCSPFQRIFLTFGTKEFFGSFSTSHGSEYDDLCPSGPGRHRNNNNLYVICYNATTIFYKPDFSTCTSTSKSVLVAPKQKNGGTTPSFNIIPITISLIWRQKIRAHLLAASTFGTVLRMRNSLIFEAFTKTEKFNTRDKILRNWLAETLGNSQLQTSPARFLAEDNPIHQVYRLSPILYVWTGFLTKLFTAKVLKVTYNYGMKETNCLRWPRRITSKSLKGKVSRINEDS